MPDRLCALSAGDPFAGINGLYLILITEDNLSGAASLQIVMPSTASFQAESFNPVATTVEAAAR